MENSDLKQLKDFAEAAKKTMQTILNTVEEAKKNMSEEEIKAFDIEMAKHDSELKAATADMNKAFSNYQDLISRG